jgi:hypothetical protein
MEPGFSRPDRIKGESGLRMVMGEKETRRAGQRPRPYRLDEEEKSDD